MAENFEQAYGKWLDGQIQTESNVRRSELLKRGLGHGTIEFMRQIWFPAIGNLDDLHAEWEVRDYHGGYRYIDLAYRPGGAKGAIEIQGYGSHARDLDTRRFKDLCWRHSLLSLDGWTLLPVAYLSIVEEPERCRQLVLAFAGRFLSDAASDGLNWLEEETMRYARRRLAPFAAGELAEHLRVSDRHARLTVRSLVERHRLVAAEEKQRYRTYRLADSAWADSASHSGNAAGTAAGDVVRGSRNGTRSGSAKSVGKRK
ncbi:transcriptional regulator [Saccharibacillus sp. O23]|uniref:transcriptional regulator n=1 Tax=Saccharibacillus sp. O23 TaxID=2009338 RepID=UPI0026D120B5|nr:transcriptional regulator [Saccharibacillus sp. O23]